MFNFKNLVHKSSQQFAKKKTGGASAAKKGGAVQKKLNFGKLGTNLKMGIVGMANVGKSSTYNLLSKQAVPAENFPFCTIDPNTAVLQIPDSRFTQLCDLYKPQSEVCATIQLTDIAGLVKGASEGEGLGNEFLANIKNVDGIFQVVRSFENDKILHTEGFMDPVRDLEIIKDELIKKDLQFLDGSFNDVSRKASKQKTNQELQQQVEAIKKAIQYLNEGKWLRFQEWTNQEIQILNKYHLLATKPITFLINQSEKDYLKQECKFENEINQWVTEFSNECQIINYSVEHEQKLFDNKEKSQKLEDIVLNGYKLLNLIHYFTVGPDEVRCWTIKKDSTAPQASAAIHTDFEKGFVSADVLQFEDFLSVGIDKIKKKVRKEGKDYIVQDGDIINFKCKISK